MMKWIAFLIAALSCTGCNREPERPRFIPAAGPSAPGNQAAGSPSGDAPPPRKIEMH